MTQIRLSLLLTAVLLVSSLTSAQAQVREIKNLPYKDAASGDAYEKERCKLDLYLPETGRDFPVLVWLHGGGLTAGSKDGEHQTGFGRRFAAQGVAVAMVNYRLSPKAAYPAYVEDSAAAFAWVKKHIASHGGDPGQVFLGGHSAGAYLALMVALDPQPLKDWKLDATAIRGLVPVAGQTLTHYTIRQERGLPKDRLLADAASPLYHVRKDAPPMLILCAEKDMAMRVEENQLLAAALRAAGHKHTHLKVIKDRSHSSVAHDMANAGDAGLTEVMGFIRSQGGKKGD